MARSDKTHLQEKYEQFKQKIKILRKDNAKCNDDFSNFINVDRQKGVLVMKNVREHERRLNVSETLKLL